MSTEDDKKASQAQQPQQVQLRTPKGVLPQQAVPKGVEAYTPRISKVEASIESAEVRMASGEDTPVDVPEYEIDYNAIKVIKPRKSQARMWIGGKQYSFTAGKKCLVPHHVAIHLEEKGFL